MSAEANKSVVTRLYRDLFVHWDVSLIDELFSASFVDHLLNRRAGSDLDVTGPEAVHQLYNMLRSAFPDLVFRVDDMIAEDDKVLVRWTWTCTHLGEFAGLAPTGTKNEVAGMALYRLEDGQIVERWVSTNLDRLIAKLSDASA